MVIPKVYETTKPSGTKFITAFCCIQNSRKYYATRCTQYSTVHNNNVVENGGEKQERALYKFGSSPIMLIYNY